jgi:hypothetical protein
LNKNWDLYYRGVLNKWTGLLKPDDEKKIKSSLFKRYLDKKNELDSLVKEMNKLESEVSSTYILLNTIPHSMSDKENLVFLEELIVYINSKEPNKEEK